MNCLAYARENTTGYTMYVSCEPCDGCMKVMRAFRLKQVIWPDGQREIQ